MLKVLVAIGDIFKGIAAIMKGIKEGITNAKAEHTAKDKTSRNDDILDGLSKRNANK